MIFQPIAIQIHFFPDYVSYNPIRKINYLINFFSGQYLILYGNFEPSYIPVEAIFITNWAIHVYYDLCFGIYEVIYVNIQIFNPLEWGRRFVWKIKPLIYYNRQYEKFYPF